LLLPFNVHDVIFALAGEGGWFLKPECHIKEQNDNFSDHIICIVYAADLEQRCF